MGKKKNKQEASKNSENPKKENGPPVPEFTVVLKTDFHCDGCASKLIKHIRSFDGVETAMLGERNTIMVIGDVDPVELREAVELKNREKVQLVWPVIKADGEGGKPAKKKESKGNEDDKQATVTTAVLKVYLHCDGCIKKIHKTVTKAKGFKEMKIDLQKDLVVVTGAMDMKALADQLQKQLKKEVSIVIPVKEGDKKEKGGGGDQAAVSEGKTEGNKLQAPVFPYPMPYPYPNPSPYPYHVMYGPGFGGGLFNYNPYSVGSYHAPQMFSDENPNACSVM